MPKLLITGASGLVGKRFLEAHKAAGRTDVAVLPRERLQAPLASDFAADFIGVDQVLHLAGEPVAAKRWSAGQMRRIRDSRVLSTQALVSAFTAELQRSGRSGTFVTASAVGFYGDRGEELLTEASAGGQGFLADVVREWETAALSAQAPGLRTVALRIGVVLDTRPTPGGALAEMLPVFRAGLGGPLGSGLQWMSWIHLDDLVRVLGQALTDPAWQGFYNAVAPEPVRNADFTALLASSLGKVAKLRAPKLALRFALGARAELLLGSQRVVPERLLQAGFAFSRPTLASALAWLAWPPGSRAALEAFHRRHKFLLSAHSPELAKTLGACVGQGATEFSAQLEAYRTDFEAALREPATPGKRANVLQHALGHLKAPATEEERQALLAEIEAYQRGDVPFGAPLQSLLRLARRYRMTYLLEQVPFFASS